MNKRVIVYVLGAVLLIEAALMLLPLLVAVIYREKNGWYFLWVLLGAAVLGAAQYYLVFSLVLVALGLFVGSRPFPIARLRGWVGSLLGAAASFAVLAGLILTVYASNDLYNSFRVSNAYYIPSVFNELGFPYCFCHQFTTYLRASVGRRRPAGTRAATPVWGRM